MSLPLNAHSVAFFFPPSLPWCVKLSTAPQELCETSLRGASDNFESRGRESTEREWVPQRVPLYAIVLTPAGC